MPNPSPLRAATAHTPFERQGLRNPQTAISPVGHFAKQAGILSPLMIAEFVKDPERQLRYTRIALILVTVLSEALSRREKTLQAAADNNAGLESIIRDYLSPRHRDDAAAHQRKARGQMPRLILSTPYFRISERQQIVNAKAK